MDKTTLTVIAIGTLLRFLILEKVPSLCAVLDEFVLFSTPINSYRSLNEGIFLLSNNMNPYTQGEILHHPPILLWIFNVLKNSQVEDNFSVNFLYAIIDALICLQLIKINKLLNKRDRFSSLKIASFYLFNPFTILTTLSKSTCLFNNLIIVSMLGSIMTNNYEIATILLSVSSYLVYSTWPLIIPLSYFIFKSEGAGKTVKALTAYIVSLMALFATSYYLCDNSTNFINLCYVTIIKFKKITPNLGLWWYLFTEMFQFFTNFYLAIFNIYTFIFVIPLTLRFIYSKNKLSVVFVIWMTIGLINFSKPYPVLADYSLFYSTVFLFKPIYAYLKFTPLVSYLALVIVLLQAPTFYVVWMLLYSGNANFFYAISLALGLVSMIIMSDFIWAYIQREYYMLHPDKLEDGKPLSKLTQI